MPKYNFIYAWADRQHGKAVREWWTMPQDALGIQHPKVRARIRRWMKVLRFIENTVGSAPF